MNELLEILSSNGHPDIPKDFRTVIRTPRAVSVETKCGGDYCYLGLENGIKRKLEELNTDDVNVNLIVNVDGIPLFKSSLIQAWPILCRFSESTLFIVRIFCAKSKPSNSNEYMRDFITEFKALKQNGFLFNNIHRNISTKGFSCDAPAHQFLKCIKSHNGYFGCERCKVEGEYVERRMIFAEFDCPLRKDGEFDRMLYDGNHQLSESALSSTGILCVKDFALDYMHLACLGVMKRLLLYWKEGPRLCRLSQNQLSRISGTLRSCAGSVPSEFARYPRGLEEVKKWKATEFRQFMVYTGLVALKDIFK